MVEPRELQGEPPAHHACWSRCARRLLPPLEAIFRYTKYAAPAGASEDPPTRGLVEHRYHQISVGSCGLLSGVLTARTTPSALQALAFCSVSTQRGLSSFAVGSLKVIFNGQTAVTPGGTMLKPCLLPMNRPHTLSSTAVVSLFHCSTRASTISPTTTQNQGVWRARPSRTAWNRSSFKPSPPAGRLYSLHRPRNECMRKLSPQRHSLIEQCRGIR